VKLAVDEPAATVIGDCTVATAGLLLVSTMLEAADGAAASVTVPCPVKPMPIVDAVSATLDTAGPLGEGDAGELEPPHRVKETAANSIQAEATKALFSRRWLIRCLIARAGPLAAPWLSRFLSGK